MEKKILFCNTAWMKNYEGAREEDQPINGGRYIEDIGLDSEVYNFLDDNGKCYGFAMVDQEIELENHYKDIQDKDEYVDGVLVVWVATNEDKETRIVGWYKNARVYREGREVIFFTDQNANKYYNIEAAAVDCFLLPVEDRTYPMIRASEKGQANGLDQLNIWHGTSQFAKNNIAPEVIQYIEDYDGDYSNFVYQEELVQDEVEKTLVIDDFDKIYQAGLRNYEDEYYYDSIIYFKAAIKIEESIDLLYKLGECLYYMGRYAEAIEIFNKIISQEGETIDSLLFLVHCHDFNRDREKTIEYSKRLIDFPRDQDNDIENKIFIYHVMFDIYVYENKLKEAEQIIDNLEDYLKNADNYSKEDRKSIVKNMKDILEYSRGDLER